MNFPLEHFTVHFASLKDEVTGMDVSTTIVKNVSRSVSQSRGYFAGAGTIYDISGSRLKYPNLGSVARDREVLKQDFQAVGSDLKKILRNQHKYLSR